MQVLNDVSCRACGAHAGEACVPACDDPTASDATVFAQRRPLPSRDAWVVARAKLLEFVGLPQPLPPRDVGDAIGPRGHAWWNVSLRGL